MIQNVLISEDYLASRRTSIPICKAEETGDNKDQSCQFPFRFRGDFQRGCITRGSKNEKFWCPTAVGKRRSPLKGKRGNCDPETCQSLDFSVESRYLQQIIMI